MERRAEGTTDGTAICVTGNLGRPGAGRGGSGSGGLAPVINLSTNYEQQPDGSHPQGRVYTRADNPTSEHAERLLAELEGGGGGCVLFGSGMAAATAVFQSLLPGDHVLVSRVLYWGVRKWLAEFALPGAWTWSSPTPPILTSWPPRSARAAPGCYGWNAG